MTNRLDRLDRFDRPNVIDRRDLTYKFSDLAGLLNYVHGLSQWIYSQPDVDVRDPLIDTLHAALPRITLETGTPLYLSLPAESANWPIQPGAIDGAELVAALPTNVKAYRWTDLALLLALEPTSVIPRRDDLVFLVQGTRADLLAILDAIFALEREHAEEIQLLLAPISLGQPSENGSAQTNDHFEPIDPSWLLKSDTPADQALAVLIKVSGLRRFYLLEKTATDPHLRLFYRHVFPPYVPVPPGLQLYAEWGYRYPLPPASFIMEAWQRDKLGMVLLAAPQRGEPLIIPPEVVFRQVLQVAGDVRLTDNAESASLKPLTAPPETKLLDLQLRLQKRPVGDTRENPQALRHQIQNDLWRLQRMLAREREAGARRLYVYADDSPRDMDRLREFVVENPLAVLNEFKYFCGKFRERVYHLALLPAEDGTGVVTPDRFPDPPAADQIFRREPAWAAQPTAYELYLPRDSELYPSLAPGVENHDALLKQILGMTPENDYATGKVLVMLWPDSDGALANFHISLDSFVELGSAGQSLNTHILAPETVRAIAKQVSEGLHAALQPDQITGDLSDLRQHVVDIYQSAWEVARLDLDKLLARGLEAEQIAQSVRARFGAVQSVDSKQAGNWQAFLEQIIGLAEGIETRAIKREEELDRAQTELIARLRTQIENNHARRLTEKFEQVAQAVRAADSPEKRIEIAAMLDVLAAEIRSGGNAS